jgi:hypothetical protein
MAFMDKVSPEPNSGCWLWAAATNGEGYGIECHGGKNWLAHRVSYNLHRGLIPNGMCVLHKCDTPACVNPDHLFLGSHADNSRDRENKGRNGNRKLTKGQVLEICAKRAKGFTLVSIAKEYGISATHVSSIYHGKHRRFINEP